MKVGDLVKWESVKNDIEAEFDTDYGIVLEFMQCHDVQFYDETVWLPIHHIQVIDEQ